MIIHIIVPCRMEEKCAGSQLVYIDDHSYLLIVSTFSSFISKFNPINYVNKYIYVKFHE